MTLINIELMSTVGRPRIQPRTTTGDPRDEILEVAAGLFTSIGYAAASTRVIAEAVGLRQASLFHYYTRKEEILADLLDLTLRPTLEIAKRLEGAQLGPAATLWATVERDVFNLCASPHNLGAIYLLPEAKAEQFEWFWRQRQRLFSVYRRQIRRGTEAGIFEHGADPLAADLIFGLVESVITGSAQARRNRKTPSVIADASLRILGAPPQEIEEARVVASRFLATDKTAVPPPVRARRAAASSAKRS